MSDTSRTNGPTKSLEVFRGGGGFRERMADSMAANATFDPDILAAMDKRDNSLIEDEIIHGAQSSAFVYSIPIAGSAKAEGITVVGARELAAVYGGIHVTIISSLSKRGSMFISRAYPYGGFPGRLDVQKIADLADEEDFYEVTIEVHDIKTGNKIPSSRREYRWERRSADAMRRNPAQDPMFERPHLEQIAFSKAFRNGVTSILPQTPLLAFKEKNLALRNTDQRFVASVMDEKRSGVLRYAAAKAISLDRHEVEGLTLAQISGLSDAAREGRQDAFIAAATALGIATSDTMEKIGPNTIDPREELKRRVAEEAEQEAAQKAAAEASGGDKTTTKRQTKRTKADDAPPADETEPPKDNDMVRALQLVDDLAKVKYQHEYDEVINAAIKSWARRMAETRADIKAIVENADKAAVARIKQKEPPPSDGPPWEALGAPPE